MFNFDYQELDLKYFTEFYELDYPRNLRDKKYENVDLKYNLNFFITIVFSKLS